MRECNILRILMNGLRGNPLKHHEHRKMERGDVISVAVNELEKRYGIWAGADVILFGEDRTGKYCVHKHSFEDFMQGAKHFSIYEFPKSYGFPKERLHPILWTAIITPQESLLRKLRMAMIAEKYKRYSPEEILKRAESRIGSDNFVSSEHFAVWCKTGISESHELEALREMMDWVIVY